MAPNLKELSLRRMKISNRAFTNIVIELKNLHKIDISDCPFIEASGVSEMLDRNKYLSHIQACNSKLAIDNYVIEKIASLEHGLTFLDISFSTHVTDEGFAHFKNKILPLTKLFINGLSSISSQSVVDILNTC